MHKLLLTLSLAIGFPSLAFAEPIGRWWSGYGQGTLEYGIKNDSAGNDTVYIACAYDHTTINFDVGGKDPRPRSLVVVVIGADEWELYVDNEGMIPTSSHVAADNFISLWKGMRNGSSMRVRLSTGESTVFSLSGSSKALPKEPCKTDFYDR